jgi:hypothetical protein
MGLAWHSLDCICNYGKKRLVPCTRELTGLRAAALRDPALIALKKTAAAELRVLVCGRGSSPRRLILTLPTSLCPDMTPTTIMKRRPREVSSASYDRLSAAHQTIENPHRAEGSEELKFFAPKQFDPEPQKPSHWSLVPGARLRWPVEFTKAVVGSDFKSDPIFGLIQKHDAIAAAIEALTDDNVRELRGRMSSFYELPDCGRCCAMPHGGC